MTDKKLFKLALEALQKARYRSLVDEIVDPAITALKERLADPMREVQRLGQDADSFCDSNCVWTDHHPDCKLAQPEQEPVACRTLCELCIKRGYHFCANAAKTTPITTPPAAQPAPVQEPVAWMIYWNGEPTVDLFRDEGHATREMQRLNMLRPQYRRRLVPLYTTPPAAQRLEAVNAQLLGALIVMVDNFGPTSSDDVRGLGEARAAIAAAKGET